MACPAESDINVFPSQNRVIAVGDIHGDLGALEYCLQYAAEVIDASWRWVGQDTYVVVVGDLIDRYRPGHTYLDAQTSLGIGEIQDEELVILERLSSLDKEARKQGGRVLKVLGNHEIMNIMDRDFKYVTPNASKMPDRAARLLKAIDRCAVYGLLQIGDWLFAHGGVVEDTFRGLEGGENFYTRIQKDAHKALALSGGHKKELGPILESVLWDRTWSDKSRVDCDRLDKVFGRLIPYLHDLGFTSVKASNMHMVVAHSVQSNRSSGYVPGEVIADLKDTVILGGKLEKKQDMPQGINSDCQGKIWRVDTGMSRSFDAPSFDNDGKTRAILWARRPQVLEVLDHGQFVQVAISKLSLPRPTQVYRASDLAFPQDYLVSLGYVFD
jgi:hypothetical protein